MGVILEGYFGVQEVGRLRRQLAGGGPGWHDTTREILVQLQANATAAGDTVTAPAAQLVLDEDADR